MNLGDVISIVSPKGGVGKTSITVNLGIALVKYLYKKVIVIDTNAYAANLSFYLGMPHLPITLNDMIKWKLPAEKVTYEHESGLHVIPASLSIENEKDIINKLNLKRLINEIRRKYDYILLDSAPGMGEDVRSIIEISDEIILVTTPDTPTLLTSYKAVVFAEEHRTPLRVVINKVMGNKHELAKEEIKDALKTEIFEEIPYDFRVYEAVMRRIPALYISPTFRNHIISMASKLTGEEIKKKGIFDVIREILRL